MLLFEVPEDIFNLIEWASKDVHRDQNSPSWSPYKLDEPLATFWAVEKAQGVTDNGGFQYFFENDWPEQPPYSLFVEAFRRIGAQEAADCLEQAVAIFPSTSPQLDYQMRRNHMDFLQAKEGEKYSAFDKLGSRVIHLSGDTFTRLAKYILDHIDSFPTVKKNAKKAAAANRRKTSRSGESANLQSHPLWRKFTGSSDH